MKRFEKLTRIDPLEFDNQGASVWSAEPEIEIGNSKIFLRTASSLRETFESKEREELIRREGATRLNLMDPTQAFDPLAISEVDYDRFSWWVVLAPELGREFQAPPPKALSVERTTSVAQADQEILLARWKRDYIEGVMAKYSPRMKDLQLSTFADRFSKGEHLIFRLHENLVAHGCFHETTQPILNLKCSYGHQWVDESVPKELRREIHRIFFGAYRNQKLPAMTGIGVENKKSLSHFMKNGFTPVILSHRIT